MLALLFFCFVALLILAKWAIGRFAFQLRHSRLALFTSSPILYLPSIPIVMFMVQRVTWNFSDAFYDANGDGHVVLGINIVFLGAFIAALGAMLTLDALLVAQQVANESGHDSRSERRRDLGLQRAPGWTATLIVDLAMWFFWIVVYYAIQFPSSLDFDG